MAIYSDPSQTQAAMNNNVSAYGQAQIDALPPTSPDTANAGSTLDYKPRAYDEFNANEYNVNSLQYPSDLMSANNQYGGNYIIFYINTQQDSKVNVSGGVNISSDYADPSITYKSSGMQSDLKLDTTSATEQTAGKLGIKTAVGAAIGGAATKSLTGVKLGGAAGALTGAGDAMRMGIILDKAATKTRATKRLNVAIALHTPNSINVSYGADWDAQDTAAAQMAGLMFGGISTPKMLATIGKHQALSGQELSVLGVKVPGTEDKNGIGALGGAQIGQAANSKKEMMFKGVDFRTFSFDYKFAPRNVQELKLVQNIIKMFKFHMHPEYVDGTGNYLYLYPSEFDILYYNNGNESRHLPRYTSCVLTSMGVSSTPNGNFTAFGGSVGPMGTSGAPTEMHITLQFKELAQLSKKEIADGY